VSTDRFKFGLQRVRDVRAHDEDRAKEAFAASLQARVRGAALLAEAVERLQSAQERHRIAVAARSGADLASMQAWLERVEQSRHDAEVQLRAHEAELTDRRRALVEASRRREALDRLKERRRAEYAVAATRAEGARLDEIALNAHVRRGAA
jgi:flagellar FliJ protein